MVLERIRSPTRQSHFNDITIRFTTAIVGDGGALSVCDSCCSHGEDISMRALNSATSAIQPPYNRHTTAILNLVLSIVYEYVSDILSVR